MTYDREIKDGWYIINLIGFYLFVYSLIQAHLRYGVKRNSHSSYLALEFPLPVAFMSEDFNFVVFS